MNLDVVLASNFLDDFLEPDESLDPQAAFRGSFSSILTVLNASAELLFRRQDIIRLSVVRRCVQRKATRCVVVREAQRLAGE